MFKSYFGDGANWQAQAVACYLNHAELEKSWSDEKSQYLATPSISRWENCREQGYVISLRAQNHKQINIAFFEHRNSDSIHTVMWEQRTLNAPTIDTAQFGDIYKDKFDTSASFSYGEIVNAGDWIREQLENFWCNNLRSKGDV